MAFDGPNTATNLSEKIRLTRESLGVGRTEFANLLGMNAVGERTVRGWETGEHIPTKKKLEDISLPSNVSALKASVPTRRRTT